MGEIKMEVSERLYPEHFTKEQVEILAQAYRIRGELRRIDVLISKESSAAVENDNLLTAWRKVNSLQGIASAQIQNIKNQKA